jgi:hypothetical protein
LLGDIRPGLRFRFLDALRQLADDFDIIRPGLLAGGAMALATQKPPAFITRRRIGTRRAIGGAWCVFGFVVR